MNAVKDADRRVLVMAADERYVMPMTVALRSIQDTLAPGVVLEVFIFDGGIRRTSRWRTVLSLDVRILRLRWLPQNENTVAGLPVFGHIRSPAYYRIRIPDLLPRNLKRAVYLDSDILVRGDISPLWEEPFRGAPLLAIQDGSATVSHPTVRHHFLNSDVGADEPYLNSGVLAFNLQAWREGELSDKIVTYIRDNAEKVTYWDQDGINAILVGRWGRLGREWNCRVDCGNGTEADCDLDKAMVWHFASSAKPWHDDVSHPTQSAYLACRQRTCWAPRDRNSGRLLYYAAFFWRILRACVCRVHHILTLWVTKHA